MRPTHQPEGIELIAEAVHAWEAAKAKTATAEVTLHKARAEEAAAVERLRALVAAGRCDHPSDARHGIKGVNGAGPKPLVSIDDESVPKVWRIGFMLFADPVLDYQGTAERLWGPGLDKKTAKNRVNAHVTHLKTLGVIETCGSNTFRVNPAKLAEHSGMPVEAPS